MSRKARIHIGTSGWNYPHWRGRFYPQELTTSDWFAHYSDVFDTVEINNTFYQLPGAKTFDQWKQQAPRRFTYAVKANRFITHLKKLKNPAQPLHRFLTRARRLGLHLGPVLYQLPPHWNPDVARLRDFCARLPEDLIHVLEFRERDWLNDEVYELMQTHNVCLCVHDLLKRHPRRITGKAVYVRFHGAGSKYGGHYSRRRLKAWAAWMKEALSEGHDVYAYFNNDAEANAVRNALDLRDVLGVG